MKTCEQRHFACPDYCMWEHEKIWCKCIDAGFQWFHINDEIQESQKGYHYGLAMGWALNRLRILGDMLEDRLSDGTPLANLPPQQIIKEVRFIQNELSKSFEKINTLYGNGNPQTEVKNEHD